MSHCESLERAVFFEYNYNTPISKVRHRKTGNAGQRCPVIERGGRSRARLGQEALRLFGSLALGDVASDSRSSHNVPEGVFYRRDGYGDVDPLTVFLETNGFVVTYAHSAPYFFEYVWYLVITVGR